MQTIAICLGEIVDLAFVGDPIAKAIITRERAAILVNVMDKFWRASKDAEIKSRLDDKYI